MHESAHVEAVIHTDTHIDRMRGTAALLLSGFLLALLEGQTVKAADWLSDLLSGVDQMNRNLQLDIQRMNQQIQQDVSAQVAGIHKNVNAQVAQIHKNVNEEVARANQDAAEAIKNAGKGGSNVHLSSLRLGPGSSSIIVNSNSGTSRSVQSGTGPDGKPYYVESENVVIGERLFHTDRIYNYTTKNLEERKYTLNLSDPNAKPVTLAP